MIIRKAGMADTEAYLRLLHEVKSGMTNSEWFFLDPDEKVRDMMEEGSMELWVAEDAGKLAGAFSIIHPGLNAFNLGNDLGFEKEQLKRVVHMDTAAVHPDYRGLKLQSRLMAAAGSEIAKSGQRILLCTVHPENQYSLRNVQKLGYQIMKKLEKYGSVRYILRKDLP